MSKLSGAIALALGMITSALATFFKCIRYFYYIGVANHVGLSYSEISYNSLYGSESVLSIIFLALVIVGMNCFSYVFIGEDWGKEKVKSIVKLIFLVALAVIVSYMFIFAIMTKDGAYTFQEIFSELKTSGKKTIFSLTLKTLPIIPYLIGCGIIVRITKPVNNILKVDEVHKKHKKSWNIKKVITAIIVSAIVYSGFLCFVFYDFGTDDFDKQAKYKVVSGYENYIVVFETEDNYFLKPYKGDEEKIYVNKDVELKIDKTNHTVQRKEFKKIEFKGDGEWTKVDKKGN